MEEDSDYTIPADVLREIPRASALEEVLGQFEVGRYALPFGDRRITLSPLQRLGAGGEGVTYRSGDNLEEAVKLRPVLSSLPPLPQFGEGPVAVSCRFLDGVLELERWPSGQKARIYGLKGDEKKGYAFSRAELDLSKACSNIPGAVDFLDGTYVLVVEEGGSQLLAGLLTKFIDGKTLEEHLRAGDLSLQEKLAIIADLGDTLETYHQRRIVHGDIKPSNILIDKMKRPTLIDHGLSRRLQYEFENRGAVCGTPHYLSPEAATNFIHRRTDWYSLGVVAYELLTGELPYAEGDKNWSNTRHILNLQKLFYSSKDAEEFCWRVRKTLGEQGYAPRLAWSIAGASHPQPAYREAALPKIAREYADQLAGKIIERSELPTERITVKEPLSEMRRRAKESSIELELIPEMEITEDQLFPLKRD